MISTNIRFGDLFAREESLLKSIDIRTIAFMGRSNWENILTTVRLSAITPEDATTTIPTSNINIRSKFGRCILLRKVVSFSEYRGFQEGLLFKGEITYPEIAVKLSENIDICSLKDHFPAKHLMLQRKLEWNFLECNWGNSTNLLFNEDVQSYIADLGYTNTVTFVNEFMEMDFNERMSLGLIISLPFYASLKTAISPSDNTLGINVQVHQQLASDCSILYSLYCGEPWQGKILSNKNFQLKNHECISIKDEIETYNVNMQIENLDSKSGTYYSVFLRHTKKQFRSVKIQEIEGKYSSNENGVKENYILDNDELLYQRQKLFISIILRTILLLIPFLIYEIIIIGYANKYAIGDNLFQKINNSLGLIAPGFLGFGIAFPFVLGRKCMLLVKRWKAD